MYIFAFTNKNTVSKDKSSYPIDIDDVKAQSFYYKDNPDDTYWDAYISNFVIDKVVKDWETNTKYLLLDQTVNGFVPDLKKINSPTLEIKVDALNVRSIESLSYYPEAWDESSVKDDIISSFISTQEVDRDPIGFRLLSSINQLSLFPITNNLELQYKAGFENNDFTAINTDITDALAMQAAMIMDVKNGYCEDTYSTLIAQTYEEFTIIKPYQILI